MLFHGPVPDVLARTGEKSAGAAFTHLISASEAGTPT
jgi:hypothetical protein